MSGIQTLSTRDTGPDDPARAQCTGDHPDGDGKCSESLTAEMDSCPVCDTYTIFKHSKIWKARFCVGEIKTWFQAQAAYFKKQDIDRKTPKTAMGRRLLDPEVIGTHFGREIVRFKTLAQAARWRKIEKNMSRSEIGEVVNRCRGWMDNKGRQKQGHGLLDYILNSCDKFIRERPVVVKEESEFKGLANE